MRGKRGEKISPVDRLKGTEEGEQILLVNWFRNEYPDHWRWIHHSPNGGARDGRTGAKMKSMGTRAGFPDLVLYVAGGGFSGLVIELKHPDGTGKASSAQEDWLNHLLEQGYCVNIANGYQEAVDIIKIYMEGLVL